MGCRVPLVRIVRDFQNGESPEAIRAHYPTRTIEQVNGAIAFYLDHKSEVAQGVEERIRRENEFAKTHRAPAQPKRKLERPRLCPFTPGGIPRAAIEALAIEGVRSGKLTACQARQMFGIQSRHEMDGFLKAHGVPLPVTMEDVMQDGAAALPVSK